MRLDLEDRPTDERRRTGLGAMPSHRSGTAASRSPRARVLLLATIAALVVTTFDAHAAPIARSSSASGQDLVAANGAEFSARKRYRARRGNPAAGLAMMGMMVGTVGAVIAAQQRREAREAAYNRHLYGGYYPQPYVSRHPHVHGPGPSAYPGYPPSYPYQLPDSALIGRPRIGW